MFPGPDLSRNEFCLSYRHTAHTPVISRVMIAALGEAVHPWIGVQTAAYCETAGALTSLSPLSNETNALWQTLNGRQSRF